MNNFAISSGGIGEALKRSASALNAAGNSLDESIALITAANTVVQDVDSVGTALKTISMYLRAAKTEAEEAGESTDGMAESVSELREELSKLTGGKVDIMEADGQTFKSTYDILKQISSVWSDLNDVTQANILELIGGKRQANTVVSILEGFATAEKVLETSANSAGSALAENEKVLESITGHINQMKASFEELSADVVESDVLKFLIDVVTALINIADAIFKVIDALGGLKTIAIGGGLYAAASSLVNILEALKLMKSGLQAAETMSTFTSFMTALGATGASTLTVLTGVAAAIGAVVLAVKAYKASHPSFDDLQKEAEDAQSKLSSLEEQMKTTESRIAELQRLADNGTISIVEEDELSRLKRENELLEAQILMQRELTKEKNRALIEGAQEAAKYAIDGSDTENAQHISNMSIQQLIEKRAGELASVAVYTSMGEEGIAEQHRKKAGEALEELSERQNELIEARASLMLDPEANEELIRSIDLTIDRITVAIGGATILSTIWDKVWSSDSPVEGAAEMAEQLTVAANAQAELNDELKQYGSNVDLTNRPILLRKDFEGKDSLDYDDSTKMVTINTQSFLASDWDDYASSTSAILVTPILPNGEVLSQDELDAYVATLIDPKTGEFDAARDQKYGIVIGVADEGDASKSLELLDDVAQKAHEANEEFASLYLSDEVQSVLDYLSEIGYDLEGITAGELADMFEQTDAIASAAEDADVMFKNLYGTVSALSEKKGLLRDLAEDMTDGSVSDSTLNSLHEQYSSLDDIITQYRLGLATAKDVYAEYKKLYEQDEDNLLRSTRWKIGLSEDYFNENIKGNAEMVKILGSYYTTDYENYKELAQEKEKIDTALLEVLGEKWADHYSSYADAVRAMVAKTYNSKSVFYRNSNLAKQYNNDYDAYVAAMGGDMLDYALKLDEFAAKLRTDLELRLPESSSSSSSKVEEYIADIDEYREAIERLEQSKLRVDKLDSQLDLAENVQEEISLRSQLLGSYENEIEAQETLNKLRHEGIANGAEKLRGMGFDVSYDAELNSFLVNNLEHINELEAKTKGNHKSLQEATNELRKETEEYIEKLEELNDDNRDGEENWRSLKISIRDAKTEIVNGLKDIASAASEALDEIQNVYDTLRNAADDYENNSGYLGIDTYQSLLELGPQYLQYLRSEKGALVITREKIEEVIAAKIEQLALDNAMTYTERLRLALQEDSIEDLNELLYATTETTNATWGLVYANIALLDLNDSQREAALHNIDAMRSLADNVREGLKFNYSKDSMNDLINYTMDMLRDKINEQIDALEEMKDAYSELIDLKKKSLDASKDEADHQKDVAKRLKEIAKLQARIDILSLDNSREAQAERAKLAEELAELQDGLSESQRDYAIEQQKEALDKMQEDYESQKDDEIAELEKSMSSEEKIYRMAIQHISENWNSLYDELIDWNTEMGSSINREITQAWEDAALMVERYGGNVREALSDIASDSTASAGGLTVSTSNNYSHDSAVADEVYARVTRMKQNSKDWSSASDAKRCELEAENRSYAAEISSILGEELVLDSSGVWHIGSKNGEKLYEKYAGKYHTGGIVGEKESFKSNELLAKLEKGEFVVPEESREALFKTLSFIADMNKTIDTSNVRDMSLYRNAELIRELTNSQSNRVGDIHFGDVYIYGASAETAAKHREINREFTNEVLKQLNIKR